MLLSYSDHTYWAVLNLMAIVFLSGCNSDSSLHDQSSLMMNYVAMQDIPYTNHVQGFYYSIIDSGDVDIPTNASSVIISYDMYDLDDQVIEQVDTPITIQMQRLFNGVMSGLKLIGRTGQISLILPSSLAAGSQGNVTIVPDMALRIDVQMIEHYIDITAYHQRLIVAYLKANNLTDTLVAGDSYYIHTELGLLNPIRDSSQLTLHYTGYLLDGTVFDDRYSRIDTTILLSKAIKGWQDVLINFFENSEGRMFIPSESAYGIDGLGAVPPDTPVAFDFRITRVQ